MKKTLLLLLAITMTTFISCNGDDDAQFETYVVANAVLESKESIRAQISIDAPVSLEKSGKIYTYKNYIFVNDVDRGIHVIDSRQPSNPKKIAFIRLPGNRDIEVRNDILYGDSYTDLVLFDISSIDNIIFLQRYADAFDGFGFGQAIPEESFSWKEFGDYNPSEQFVTGWTYETREIEIDPDVVSLEDAVSATPDAVGQGGSFARFKIVNNYLYAVDVSTLYTFELNGTTATEKAKEQIGWNIETIFNQEDHLYIGSANGMLIFDINNPEQPTYKGEIFHWEGCDPVVVKGDYAYLTLRGGNECGQDLSFLQVIDVSDKTNPIIIDTYDMEEPYGLGFHNDTLYVSDGENGLKTFDATNPEDLIALDTIEDIAVFDIIPLQDRLLAIAGSTLYQFSYTDSGLEELSAFEIN